MKAQHFNVGDVLGLTAMLGTITLGDMAAAVTILAMAPLAYWRWRAIWRERNGKARDEKGN